MGRLSAPIKKGYYMKARKIQESAIATAPPHVREIWDWILKEANHSDTNVCLRGQTVRTYEDIQEGLKWYVGWRKHTYKKHHCEISMKWLKKATMITTKKTTKGMVITVLNYDYYQTSSNYESYNETTTKPTRKLQTTDTINKNVKNDKNDNTPAKQEGKDKINSLIKLFENINPSAKNYYKNTTQRNACKQLIETYTYDRVSNIVKNTLKVTNERDFHPKVTTPYMLFDKWVSLEIAVKKYNRENKIVKKKISTAEDIRKINNS